MERKKVSEEYLDKVFDNEYYKMAKRLQIWAALWPFQQNYGKKIQQILIIL